MTRTAGDEFETRAEDIAFIASMLPVRADDVLWEPFRRDGSRNDPYALLPHRNQVVRTSTNFFDTPMPEGVTAVITNPPFSKKAEVMRRLVELGNTRPHFRFALILPTIVMQRVYFDRILRMQPRQWEILMPNNTVRFLRDDGTGPGPKQLPLAAFKCAFFICRPLDFVPSPGQTSLSLTHIRLVEYPPEQSQIEE